MVLHSDDVKGAVFYLFSLLDGCLAADPEILFLISGGLFT